MWVGIGQAETFSAISFFLRSSSLRRTAFQLNKLSAPKCISFTAKQSASINTHFQMLVIQNNQFSIFNNLVFRLVQSQNIRGIRWFVCSDGCGCRIHRVTHWRISACGNTKKMIQAKPNRTCMIHDTYVYVPARSWSFTNASAIDGRLRAHEEVREKYPRRLLRVFTSIVAMVSSRFGLALLIAALHAKIRAASPPSILPGLPWPQGTPIIMPIEYGEASTEVVSECSSAHLVAHL